MNQRYGVDFDLVVELERAGVTLADLLQYLVVFPEREIRCFIRELEQFLAVRESRKEDNVLDL